MIVDVMLFWVIVSALAAGGAWCAEEGLRRLGWSTRWTWLASMAAVPVLLLAPLAIPSGALGVLGGLGETMLGATVIDIPGLIVGDTSGGGALGQFLGALWIAMSGMLALVLLRTHRALGRRRSDWDPAEVQGREVYVSPDQGPAVAGVLRPWIVLPAWALDLSEHDLDLVVTHEDEHVAGRDTLLLATALALLVATPWNPIGWWQLRRLRMAVEVDCDRRVLRSRPDPEAYGSVLIAVAARTSGQSLGLAAFTERSTNLRRRIMTMTERRTPITSLRSALFVLLAAVLTVQACGVDSPVTIDETAAAIVEVPEGQALTPPEELRNGPAFTPFTVAPSILNRDEVVAAMVREYPPLLRDAGIGGTVKVFFFINEDGRVEQVRIDESSGHQAIDDAAMNVAGAYEFSPALNGDEKTPVWVSFPITFQPSSGEAPPARPGN